MCLSVFAFGAVVVTVGAVVFLTVIVIMSLEVVLTLLGSFADVVPFAAVVCTLFVPVFFELLSAVVTTALFLSVLVLTFGDSLEFSTVSAVVSVVVSALSVPVSVVAVAAMTGCMSTGAGDGAFILSSPATALPRTAKQAAIISADRRAGERRAGSAIKASEVSSAIFSFSILLA